jgi:hypothetical protein
MSATTPLLTLGCAVLAVGASACGSTSSSASSASSTAAASASSASEGTSSRGASTSGSRSDAASAGDGGSGEGRADGGVDGESGAGSDGGLARGGDAGDLGADSGGEDGAEGVDSGAGDSSAGGADASSEAGAPPAAFTCNLLIGNSTTQQWFDDGFLTYPGIDPTHWELFWVAHHYIDSWANPNDTGWTMPFDMGHTCARDSATPDRVIFIVTYAPPYPPEATYQTDTTSIVNDIQAKYPTVQRIELMTLIRSPGNVSTACSSVADNEQSIPAAEDQGIAAVAADAAFAGLVFALPPFYVPSCSDFIANAPQYTTAGAMDIAAVYGAYYAASF